MLETTYTKKVILFKFVLFYNLLKKLHHFGKKLSLICTGTIYEIVWNQILKRSLLIILRYM